MEDNKFSKTPIDLAKVKRPKGYPTFTSLKATTGIYVQKPRYEGEKHGSRRLVSDLVTVSLSRGGEFDAYAAFLGTEDGKRGPNPVFSKLATAGFLRDGQRVYVGPDYLQEVLAAQLDASTNKVIRWKDRPRPAAEIALEKALEGEASKRLASEAELEKLRAILTRHKIEIPRE